MMNDGRDQSNQTHGDSHGYQLVDCDFYDRLEAWATRRQVCEVVYRTAAGELVTVQSQIVDVYAASQADFVKLKEGTVIRLDRLVSVNGEPMRLASDR